MIYKDNTQTLSDLLFNELEFGNISYDKTFIDINNNNNYNLSEQENYFLESLPEEAYDNEINKKSENNAWRIDYLSFVDNIIKQTKL